MWVLSGCLAVMGSLVGIIFWLTHAKIDNIKADVAEKLSAHKTSVEAVTQRCEEESKGELMKNDRDHREFWQQLKEMDKARELHCISRMEYEKDNKHTYDAIVELKDFMKAVNKNITELNNLMVAHMAKDNK